MKKLLAILCIMPLFCIAQEKTNIKTAEAAELILSTKKLQILDVRSGKEFATGHIDGAINIDVNSPDFNNKVKKLLKKKKPTLVYCRSGRRSLTAINKMTSLKFKKLYNLEGGILDWQKTQKTVTASN